MSRWTAIPAARSSAPILKVRLYAVLAVLAFASLSGLIAITVVVTRKPPAIPEIPAPLPAGLGEAWTAARQYVEGKPLTVPLAGDLDPELLSSQSGALPAGDLEWVGYTSPDPARVQGRTIEYHRFLLSTPAAEDQAGAVPLKRVLTVPLQIVTATDPNGKTQVVPVLVAAPSFSPVPSVAEPPKRLDWRDVPTQLEVNDALKRAAESWAKAYLANDVAGLKDVVADPQDGDYPGLGGFEATRTEVLSAAPRGPEYGVVRVEVTAKDAGGWTSAMEFDLLVKSPDKGNPEVVAWGAAGSGADLVPYENALSGSR